MNGAGSRPPEVARRAPDHVDRRRHRSPGQSPPTGALGFATTLSRMFTPDGLAIEEERRTVFREEVKAGARNEAPRREGAPADAPWRRRITPDPITLFRFSALTFNSHRIHYDYRWATETEGYPGLVVHGPFTSTL